ncbi:MAG: fumarylacetoacetate hydrolase family protein [Rhodothermus sp.]|nr:fumarylacetoacetate hydrolase family protein [Rhodothermus sp.]
MRLLTYQRWGELRAGVCWDDAHVLDIQRAGALWARYQPSPTARLWAALLLPADLQTLLQREAEGIQLLQEVIAFLREKHQQDPELLTTTGVLLPLHALQLAAPVRHPEKVLCLGRNYPAHAHEAGVGIPSFPEVFAKFASCLIGHRQPIRLPRVTNQVDFEAELAVVIGRRTRYVTEEEALSCVAGYTIFNDVSARDYQFKTSQWTLGKAFDTFAPMGPWIVTPDECPDPQKLRIQLQLNGEVMQEASTAEMVFSVATVIACLSEVMTLQPGDVIATGTPAGVGFVRTPPRFLQPGDVVRIEIERIGVLENPVLREDDP